MPVQTTPYVKSLINNAREASLRRERIAKARSFLCQFRSKGWKQSGYVNDEHWFVYFITDGLGVKVGYSCAPYDRMAKLQSGCSRQLKMMLTVPGGRDLEEAIHRKFAEDRIHGEWFSASQELADFIDDLGDAAGEPLPVEVEEPVVTKPVDAAVSFKERIEAEGKDWPAELMEAAIFLRCELDCVRRKYWLETGGPKRLADYSDKFENLYAAWRSA